MKTVERGAALLDERHPGWETEIDPEALTMSVCEECVLGQLYGDYEEGLARLALNDDEARRAGFVLWMEGLSWAKLTDAWVALLRKRGVV